LKESPPEAFWKARRNSRNMATKANAPAARQIARINPER
jgi:hypothetical protein